MRLFQIIAVVGWLLIRCYAADSTVFYPIWFSPGGPITMFQATLIIPSGSKEPHVHGNVQAVWPGMQTRSSNNTVVLQNVVTNQGDLPGEWYHLPFYCCRPAKQLRDAQKVYPGDALTSIFALDPIEKKWSDVWFNNPSPERAAAGIGAWSRSMTFDPTTYPATTEYTDAILTIELQKNSTWDFGRVEWQNIIVEANTTTTEWCIKPYGGPGFLWQSSMPQVTAMGNSIMCRIASLVFTSLS